MVNESVRIVFLGGAGEVTKNMFVYEFLKDGQIRDILVVDCGIGFSKTGEEILFPDISYLENKKEKIRGVILTHGHEDHTSALYTLLAKIKAPVYGTRLTLALAKTKLEEQQVTDADLRIAKTSTVLQLGAFSIEFVHVTHSIPDATNLIIKTPLGTFYHASDFKFDWTPYDGWQTEVGKIAKAGEKAILCLLSDCVRSERSGYTLSEETIQESLEEEVRKAEKKFFFTTQSSNISRIQQAINVALEYRRKIVFMGRSIRENVEVAKKLGYLRFPYKAVISVEEVKKYPPNKLFLIVAGSQAQEDSALSRLANNEDKRIRIEENDMVVFSADPIPGYEQQVHSLIDKMTLLGATVIYSDINDELHVSGHGSQNDLMLMLGLTHPKYIIPIGGEPRHVRQYANLAKRMGYDEKKIFYARESDAIEFDLSGKAVLLPKAVQ